MTESGKSCDILTEGGRPPYNQSDKSGGCAGSEDLLKSSAFVDKISENRSSAKKPPKSLSFRALLYNKQAVPTAFVTPHTVSMSIQPPVSSNQRFVDERVAPAPLHATPPHPNPSSMRFGSTLAAPSTFIDHKFDGGADSLQRLHKVGEVGSARHSHQFSRPTLVGFDVEQTILALNQQFDAKRANSPRPQQGFGPDMSSPLLQTSGATRSNARRPTLARLDVGPGREDQRDAEPYMQMVAPSRPSASFGADDATTPTAYQARRASLVGAATKIRADSFGLPRVCPDMPQRRVPSQLETFHSTYASPVIHSHKPLRSFLTDDWADGAAVADQPGNNFHPSYPVVDQPAPFYESDDRLSELENRMRQVELMLADQQQVPSKEFSKSLRDLNCVKVAPTTAVGGKASALWTTLPPSLSSSTNGVFYESSLRHQNGDDIERAERLSEQIKNLQRKPEVERQISEILLRQNSNEFLWKADENEALKGRVRKLETENELLNDRRRSFAPEGSPRATSRDGRRGFLAKCTNLKPSLSMDDLIKQKQCLEDTVENLQLQLARVQSASTSLREEPAPDQYVSMQRYRLLKAKSKKLLSAKCDELRAEKLAKESLHAQIQLQNEELLELRQKVYQRELQGNEFCECGTSLENLSGQREELLQTMTASSFATSCLLGVCRDLANHKTPDHDHILGLKENGMTNSSLLRNSQNTLSAKKLSTQQFYVQVIDSAKKSQKSLKDMQQLVFECFADQLANSIDCTLQ